MPKLHSWCQMLSSKSKSHSQTSDVALMKDADAACCSLRITNVT